MPKTILKQKVALIVFGIFLTAFLLETVLRIGGSWFLYRQDMRNVSSLNKGSGSYKVLCLGESTTALGGEFSYPSMLQRFFQKHDPQLKISVINKGIPSIDTKTILDNLESQLDQYNPQVVVLMIGINDEYNYYTFGQDVQTRRNFLDDLRIVKLMKYIKLHMAHKLKEGNPFVGNEDRDPLSESINMSHETLSNILKNIESHVKALKELDLKRAALLSREDLRVKIDMTIKKLQKDLSTEYIDAGLLYKEDGDDIKAEEYFKNSCALVPEQSRGFSELGRIYRDRGLFALAQSAFEQAVKNEPQKIMPHLELARLYDVNGQREKTAAIFSNFLTSGQDLYWINVEIGDWFAKYRLWAQAETAYLKVVNQDYKNVFVFEKLEDVYRKSGQKEKLSEIGQRKGTVLKGRFLPGTLKNYRLIVKKILDRRIKVIVMQYPMRTIEPLKRNLPFKDVIFVENRENFLNALKDSSYTEYFSDYFAGDFGHCTAKGNRLIVEQLAEVISRRIENNR